MKNARHPTGNRIISTITMIAFVVMSGLVWVEPATADSLAQSTPWTDPKLIAHDASAPQIVGDSSGSLHLFYVEGWYNEEADPQGQAIIYKHYTAGAWSEPVDILVSPNHTSLTLDGAVIDILGNLHVLWNDSQALYHSTAHVATASDPRGWRNSTVITGQIPIADMAQDENGRLHVVARPDPFTVSYLNSEDGGLTWSSPRLVASIASREAFAIGSVQLAISNPGIIHVTWFQTAAEVNWNFWSVWYARSGDSGQSWDLAKEMASPQFGASDIAVDSEGGIHLVYGRNIGLPDGRWHQWSQDGGNTWSEREPLFPGFTIASGDTGGYGFSSDSNGTLHLVNSIGQEGGEATAYHMQWLGHKWSQPELVMSEYAHFARIAMTMGNRLNFVAMAGHTYELWFRTSTTDAPSVAPIAIPTVPSSLSQKVANAFTQENPVAVAIAPEGVLADTPLPIGSTRPPDSSVFLNPLFLSGISTTLFVILVVILSGRSVARGRR